MTPIDFDRHNEEVQKIWSAYRSGNPIRVPVMFGTNPRYTMWMPEANPRGITFEQYFSDPQIMLERQIEHQRWVRYQVPQDAEMGLPKNGWDVYVDLQNVYEAAWLGCDLRYYPDQVPDTIPILRDDNKRMLFDKGIPDPFKDGLMRRNWEFYEYFRRRQADGWTIFDRPISSVTPCALGTDGPMTVCCNIRGATEFLIDLKEDTEFARQLLDFVTTGIITRLNAYRRYLGLPERSNPWGFADDSIELISTEMYCELILPFHKRIVAELAEPGAPISLHLCGDVQRHLLLLRDNLNIRSFDTGFPIDLGQARRELGPEIELLGGPSVPLLCYGTAQEVRAETVMILRSGVMEGGKFTLREGNNLAPGTPLEKLWAMYETAKEFGRYGQRTRDTQC
jgi:uroporphyrinogen-III decarboxylase